MLYFDNAATSFPKPPEVAQAMAQLLAHEAANPGRAGHRMAVRAEQKLDQTRLKLARFFNAPDHHRLIFAMNCTDALNMAIKGVLSDSHGVHVITTVLEHNSVSRPLQSLATSGGIELTRVTCDEDGLVDPDEIRQAIKPNTKLIVMAHASNVLGTIQDIAAVGKIAREHDLLFCVDSAQSAGVLPIDIQAMNIDLLAFPGHKSLLGPTGTGGLYVGTRCPEPVSSSSGSGDHPAAFHPWREGGTGGDSSSPSQPALYPFYLEGGTPNTVGVAGLDAGLQYVIDHDMSKTLAHELHMVQAIIDKVADDDRFILYGPRDAKRRVGTISINIQGYEPSDAASILDDSFEIAVRPGLHCSPYIHRRIGTYPAGSIRISPGPFNTDEQLATLLDALDQIAG